VWHGYLNIIQIYLDGCTNTSVFQNLIYGGTASPNKDNVQGISFGIENNNYPTTGIKVYSNVIYDCSEGVHFWNLGGVTANFTNNDIVNNTFVSCGYGIRWVNPNGNVVTPNTLRNNIFWQDTGYAIQDDTTANDGITNTTITHNGFALGQSSETKGTSYQETATHGFTDLTNRVLSLTGTSGFIDHGYTAGTPFDTALRVGSTWPDSVLMGDQDGQGTAWEIGAYVYETAGSGFLAWTETGDTRSQLTVTETRATGTCDQDTGARLWKDFGASYFDSDFTHRWVWKGNPDNLWTANETSYQGLTTVEGPYNTVIGNGSANSAWIGYMKGSDTTVTVTLRVYAGTTQEASDSTSALVTGQVYYMQLRRIGGTGWELKIWTGGYNGTLIDTLSLTASTSPAYRYCEAWSARSDGTQGNKTNWYIEDLDVEVTGATATPAAVLQLLQRRR